MIKNRTWLVQNKKTGRTIIIKDNNPSRLKILPKRGGLNIFIFQKITANLAREIERTASNERSAVLLYVIYCHAASFCRVGHRRTIGAIFIGELAQGFGIHAARIVRGCQIHFFKQRRGQAQIGIAVLIAHERAHGDAPAACEALQKALSAEAQPSL